MQRKDKQNSSDLMVFCPDYFIVPYEMNGKETFIDKCIVNLPDEDYIWEYVIDVANLEDIETWVHEFSETSIIKLGDILGVRIAYTFGTWAIRVSPAHLMTALLTSSLFLSDDNDEFIRIDGDTMYKYISEGKMPFKGYWMPSYHDD